MSDSVATSAIWVDGDATPRAVKEMLFKAAVKRRIQVTLVANTWLKVPASNFVQLRVVGKGFDVADEHIIEEVSSGDLVVSSDIPLAAAVVEKGATVVDFRGHVIDANNARERLAMRDFMEGVRESGEFTGGPAPFNDKDKHRFAGVLDRWIQRR